MFIKMLEIFRIATLLLTLLGEGKGVTCENNFNLEVK